MGTDGSLHPPGLFPLVVSFHQRAHGTNVNAGTAKFAPRFQEGRAKRGSYQRLARPFREANGVIAPNLFAGPDAAATGDTKVVVPVIKGVADFQGNLLVFVVQGRFQFHAQIAHRVLKLTPFVLGAGNAAVVDRNVAQANVGGAADVNAVAGEAAVGMLGNQHLHHRAPQFVHVLRLAADAHSVGHRESASSRVSPTAFHRYHAHPAGGKGLHSGVVAKIGHVDAGVDRRFQHHLPRLGLDFHSVNGDGYVIGH